MAEKKAVDWERIEAEYRAGVLSLREIAAQFGITHGAINKRAQRDGWTRDLSGKIHAKAEALVSKALVSKEVSAARLVTEREVIEANAERIAQVRGEHRHDITRMRALVLRLLAECEAEAAEPGVFEDIGEMLRAPDENGMDRLNDAYRKAISLPQRIKGVKELAETMRVLVTMEREAYGIADANREQPAQAKRELSEVERASRLASLLDAARSRSAAGGAPQ